MSIESIALWHKRARPTPTDAQANVQLGCHFEEIAEMVAELDSENPFARSRLKELHTALLRVSDALKSGQYTVTVEDRAQMLDAIADQIVTGVGVGHTMGMDVVKGVAIVNTSNWSKYDQDGNPIFNNAGKIAKGPNYIYPYLGECV